MRSSGSLKSARENESALPLVGEELDDSILRNIPPEMRQQLYQKLLQVLSGVDAREKMSSREAMTIILGTFMLSTVSGLIIVLTFFVIQNVEPALNLSNVLGIVLLFGVGYFRALDKNFFSKICTGSSRP